MKKSAYIKLSGESDSAYKDMFTTYGISFIKGSYLTLLKKGSVKAYVSNDSRLQHGIRMVAKPEYAKPLRIQGCYTSDEEIAAAMRGWRRPEEIIRRLEKGIIAAGAGDNYSLVCIEVRRQRPSRQVNP